MIYVTKSGDQWDLIAYQQLGSTKYTEKLINANRKYVGVVILPAGVALELPTVEREQRVAKLPPWRTK